MITCGLRIRCVRPAALDAYTDLSRKSVTKAMAKMFVRDERATLVLPHFCP